MLLEGVVTNVANFGAFVDIGVHQDGLVHISALADTFVSDPREVVKAGDIVKVRVVEVDIDRKRIGLSMRKHDDAAPAKKTDKQGKSSATAKTKKKPVDKASSAMGSAFADAFAKAKKD